MDAKMVGKTIAALRKSLHITQTELARQLCISDKAISKWESGQGFPDITQFPELARILNVSIDYLMTGRRNVITIVGNIITDLVKTIDFYPNCGMLTYVNGVTRAVGGCVPNTLIDLAKLDSTLPLSAIGRVGNDDNGRFLLDMLRHHGIDTTHISISVTAPTSFCDVMNLPSGERTFFHAKGANAEFSPDDIDLSALNCSILHAGYILLLDKFDAPDEQYGTKMARFLHAVRQKGIRTSVDVVSSEEADYGQAMLPVLPELDYIVINEYEACRIFDLKARDEEGRLLKDNVELAMRKMAEQGVRLRIVVHCLEGGFCLNAETGEFFIPQEEMKGKVGAGDAFCAGCLYSFVNGYDERKTLAFASCAAAQSLFAENSIDGMKKKDEVWQMESRYPRREDI